MAAAVGAAGLVTVLRLELSGLPQCGDVTDWLETGHTADEFRALADRAQAWDGSAPWSDPGAPVVDTGAAARRPFPV